MSQLPTISTDASCDEGGWIDGWMERRVLGHRLMALLESLPDIHRGQSLEVIATLVGQPIVGHGFRFCRRRGDAYRVIFLDRCGQ